MRIRPAQIRRRLALPALALSAVASITFAGGAEGAQAVAAPSADAVKRSAARGTTALGDSGSRYPAGVSRPRKHGGSAPRASAAAAKKRAKKPRKPKLRGNPARALLAFEAMQRYYYVRGSGLYAGEPFSYLWPFSQSPPSTPLGEEEARWLAGSTAKPDTSVR